MSHDEDLLTPVDSNSLSSVLYDLQGLLYRALSQSRPHNPDRVAELDGYYGSLRNISERLEVCSLKSDENVRLITTSFQIDFSQDQ
jgi:hypothetical protein